MNKEIRLLAFFVLVFSFFTFVCVRTSFAKIHFYDFDDLTDKDISPQGRSALHLDSDISWYHAETKHFVYHFTSYKETMEPYLDEGESYYAMVKGVFGIEKDGWNKKAHVFVFTSDSQWRQYSQRVGEGEQAQAFTSGWELYIHHSEDELSRIKTVSHELTHVILFRFLDGKPPLFLNEGFAEYVSYVAVMKQMGRDNSRVKIIRRIRSSDFIPLEQLAALETYPDGKIQTFYIESEALTRFLVTNYGGQKFYELLRDCSRGKSFAQSVDPIYKMSVHALESEFKEYVID